MTHNYDSWWEWCFNKTNIQIKKAKNKEKVTKKKIDLPKIIINQPWMKTRIFVKAFHFSSLWWKSYFPKMYLNFWSNSSSDNQFNLWLKNIYLGFISSTSLVMKIMAHCSDGKKNLWLAFQEISQGTISTKSCNFFSRRAPICCTLEFFSKLSSIKREEVERHILV